MFEKTINIFGGEPMKGENVVDMLEERFQARDPLGAEELADVLCQLGAVSFRPTRQTMAHRLHKGLPACPVFVNTRPKPDGPLTRRVIELLGGHLALAFEPYAREDNLVIAGVPQTGKLLAEGFCRQWSSQNGKATECLVLARRPKLPGFYLSQRRPIMTVTGYAIIIDNASLTGSTGCTAALALMEAGYKRIDFLFMVDCEEGAREALKAIGVTPIAHVTLKTIVSVALEKDLTTVKIWPRLEHFQNAVRGKVGLPSITLP